MSSVYVPKELRELVARQARHRCGYCLTREEIVGTSMEIEHLFPHSLGGPTTEENLWLACSGCNLQKGTRIFAEDEETGESVPLYNPRYQVWDEHFAWVDGGIRVVGRTAVGRATIDALQLNRLTLVRARRLWVTVGWHPPLGE